MKHWVVGQRSVGANPHSLAWEFVATASDGVSVDVSLIYWPWPVVPVAKLVLIWSHASLEVGECLRCGNIHIHSDLMLQPSFVLLKTCLQVENWFAVLNRNYASCGETLTVSQAVNLVQNWNARVARTKKVCVKRMNKSVWLIDCA
jgi:hypothetical protein